MTSHMEYFKKCGIVQIWFTLVFFTTAICCVIMQAIIYYGLRPFNLRLFRKLNWYLNYTVYSKAVWISDWWSNLEMLLYMDPDERKHCGKEHCIGVVNHSYEIDWCMAAVFGERFGILGNCRIFLKKSLMYVPVLGLFWKFTESIFLERSFEKDKQNIERQIKEFGDFPDPVMILFLPEGTRFTPEKHKASKEFAAKNNLPQLEYHLQPRTKGFATLVGAMKGKIKYVYDMTLLFKEDATANKPTTLNLLRGKPITAHVHVQRIHVDDLPQTDEGLKEFCRQSFIKRDKLKKSFLATGDLFATSGVPRVEMYRMPRRIYPLLSMVGWSYITYAVLKNYFIHFLISGNMYIVAGVTIFFLIMLYMVLGAAQVKNASSYGLKNGASHQNNTIKN